MATNETLIYDAIRLVHFIVYTPTSEKQIH